MNILAIETSCDETSVAIVRDGREVLANVIASQIGLHERYGGVVPELASRQHILTLIPTLEEAMRRAHLDWDGIDAIAVTYGPGLAGALLVGLNGAKALAFAREKPLVAVNHLEAHIYSNWIISDTLKTAEPEPALPDEPAPVVPRPRASAALQALGAPVQGSSRVPQTGASAQDETPLPGRSTAGGRAEYAPPPAPRDVRPDLGVRAPGDPAFPLICLVVSGGHTELIYMSDHGRYNLLGKTVDDAAGEAFDKVARILGLPYPGGPAIQRAARDGDPKTIDLPRSVLRGSYDFSFSGLKTAALRQAQQYSPPLTAEEQAAQEAEARRAEAERQEAEDRARREEEAHRAEAVLLALAEAEERARQEAEERARQEAEARQAEAEARRVEAFRREAEEYMRREREEKERRQAAQREAEEQAQREAEERERREAEAAARPPMIETEDEDEDEDDAPPAPRPPAGTPAATPGRPVISILGAPRQAPGSGPAAPLARLVHGDEEERAARPTPPAEEEEGPPPTARAPRAPEAGSRPKTPGLIRVTAIPREENAEPEANAPVARPREHFDRMPAPEITTRQASETPRVLGKSEQEEIAPPAFLAERHGGTAPTPMRRRGTPADPEMPAFLRERDASPPTAPTPSAPPPATPAASRPTTPTPARPSAPPAQQTPQTPAPPAPRRGPVQPEADETPAPPPRSALPPATRPSSLPPGTPARSSATPASGAPKQTTPPRAPSSGQAPPAPSGARPAAPPAPRPAPPPREVRPIPKSVQAGRPRKDEDAEEDIDDLFGELLASAQRNREADEDDDEDTEPEDEDLGTDDEPPPSPRPRRPVSLEGSRPPEARMPIVKRDKPPLPVADFAASFQEAAVEILVDKTVSAAAAYKVRTVLLAGGVAANTRLRERLQERLGPDIVLRSPPPILCTDNAAMVAAAAYFRYDAGLQHDWTLDIDPNARFVE